MQKPTNHLVKKRSPLILSNGWMFILGMLLVGCMEQTEVQSTNFATDQDDPTSTTQDVSQQTGSQNAAKEENSNHLDPPNAGSGNKENSSPSRSDSETNKEEELVNFESYLNTDEKQACGDNNEAFSLRDQACVSGSILIPEECDANWFDNVFGTGPQATEAKENRVRDGYKFFQCYEKEGYFYASFACLTDESGAPCKDNIPTSTEAIVIKYNWLKVLK